MEVLRLFGLKAHPQVNSTKSQRSKTKRLSRRRRIDWRSRRMRLRLKRKLPSGWRRKQRSLKSYQGVMRGLVVDQVHWREGRAVKKASRTSARFTVRLLIYFQFAGFSTWTFQVLHHRTNDQRSSTSSVAKALMARKKKKPSKLSSLLIVIVSQVSAVAELWTAWRLPSWVANRRKLLNPARKRLLKMGPLIRMLEVMPGWGFLNHLSISLND